MRTTKTVWAFGYVGRSAFRSAQTLDDPPYLAFVQELQRRGFEIASHGATMESSERATTAAALERFAECFGSVPRVYVNHAYNRENVYWGHHRLDNRILSAALRRSSGLAPDFFQGHVPDSPYWWGDLCSQHHCYVRNLTFAELNVLKINPSMPYRDPQRPHVRLWFSATDAEDRDAFLARLTPRRISRLEAEGGVCILATHLGKGFAVRSRVDPQVRSVLKDIARRNGWFVPVGRLLDWLLENRSGSDRLPSAEWSRMQRRWATDLLKRRLRVGSLLRLG
jgi:hypothetical protein